MKQICQSFVADLISLLNECGGCSCVCGTAESIHKFTGQTSSFETKQCSDHFLKRQFTLSCEVFPRITDIFIRMLTHFLYEIQQFGTNLFRASFHDDVLLVISKFISDYKG